MTFSTTIDPALRIKPELVLQQLGGIDPIAMEMGTRVFKKKPNWESTSVSRNLISRVVKSIPYVGAGTPGVALAGESQTYDNITVPPMKATLRILAEELSEIKELNGKDLNTWLSEQLAIIRETIDWNLEWYMRHFLTTGSCDYKYLVQGSWDAITYSLGTMSTTADPAVKFDNASAKLSEVLAHLDLMYETGKATGYFQNANSIVVYCRKAVWNAIHELMDIRQTNDVLSTRRVSIDELIVGNYSLIKFDGDAKDPESQTTAAAIPVKEMRMIDTSVGAPHTLAKLRLSNLNATGGQKHIMVKTIKDPVGDHLDVHVHYRPAGLFIPEAMVSGGTVLT